MAGIGSNECPPSIMVTGISDCSNASTSYSETTNSLSGCYASNENSASKEDASLNRSDALCKPKQTKDKDANDSSSSRKFGKDDVPKHRVIQSRYKQAATDAAKRAKKDTTLNVTHFNSPSSSGSSSDNSRKLTTFGKSPAKSKLVASMGDISKFSRLPNKIDHLNRKNFGSKVKTSKHEAPTAGGRSNQKLHSTALHSTTLLDKTAASSESDFSTTVMGGKCFSQKHGSSLAEISEFSLLHSPSVLVGNAESPEMTVVSVSSEKDEKSDSKSTASPVTEEALHLEYLRYLSWAFIDAKSEETYNKQVAEAEAQLSFLAHAIEVKEKEYFEAQKRRTLIRWYKNVSREYDRIKELLTKLAESSPEAAAMSEKLGTSLENRLHRVKLEDIYIPSDQEAYCQELMAILSKSCSLLDELNSVLANESLDLNETSDMFSEIQRALDLLKPCFDQVEKASSLAIQESSLKLTLKDIHYPLA